MSKSAKLSRVIEGFIFAKEAQGRAKGTISDYKINLKRFCDYLDDPPIGEITSTQINKFFYWLQNDYTYIPGNVKANKPCKLSPKTVHNAWITLSSFWNWVEVELDIKSPFKVSRIHANPKPNTPFTPDEIKKLLKACDSYHSKPRNRSAYTARRGTKNRDKAVIYFLLDTGVRASELCNMRFGDYDQANNRIRVQGKGRKNVSYILAKRLGKPSGDTILRDSKMTHHPMKIIYSQTSITYDR